MSLEVYSCFTAVVLASICVTVTFSQKAPEWKNDADALTNNYYRSVLEGSELKLLCPVKGKPKPLVEWFKYDELFVPQTPKIRVRTYSVKFLELVPTDKGNYTCVAQNSYGRIQFTYVVDVIDKVWPLKANVSSNRTVYEGETATFYCIVTNDDTARIQWLRIHNTKSRNAHEFLNISNENPEVLIIKNVSVSDAGQYTCLLGNQFGSKYEHMYLTVNQLTTTTTSTTTTTTPTTTTPTTTSTTPTTTTTTPTTTTTTPTTTSTTTTTPVTTPTTRATTTEITRIFNKKKKTKEERRKEKEERKKEKNKKKNKDKSDKKKKNKKNKKKKEKERERERERQENVNSGFKSYDVTEEPYQPQDNFDLYPYLTNNENNVDTYNQYETYNPRDPYETDFTGDAIDPSERGYDQSFTQPTNDIDEEENQTYGQGATNGTNNEAASKSSGLSVWTVYIIVGSVAGGILLAGLVAIAIALCCQKEEDSQYKSTSV